MPPADSQLRRLRTVATMLDSAIKVPGTSLRFGLDPILGLVPGLGDLAAAAMSGYIVLAGIRMGASRPVVMRMIANVAFDTIAGSVPVVGDLFDASFKSNNRNVALLEHHLAVDPEPARGTGMTMAGGILLLVLLAALGLTLAYFVFHFLYQLLQSR